MYVPAWILFFFVPGALAAFDAVMPFIIGLSLLFLVYAGMTWLGQWIGSLLTCAAKALPACWLFDGDAGPPVEPKPRQKDDGPSPRDYHTSGGWHEAYKAWEAGKPIPFNAHNVHWRDY